MCLCVHVCVYVCMYVCLYVCLYIKNYVCMHVYYQELDVSVCLFLYDYEVLDNTVFTGDHVFNFVLFAKEAPV